MKTIFLIFLLALSAAAGAETISYLTDIKAVYFYEEAESIDWPTVYYLNAENGCQVDLVSLLSGPTFQKLTNSSKENNLNSYRYLLPDISPATIRKTLKDLFGSASPDIIILDESLARKEMTAFADYISNAESDTAYGINVNKIYRKINGDTKADVHLNARLYYSKHLTAMSKMAASVNLASPSGEMSAYSHYKMEYNRVGREGDKPSFLSGLKRFKFHEIVESQIGAVLPLSELGKLRDEYLKKMSEVAEKSGDERIDALMSARSELSRFDAVLKRDYVGENYPSFLGRDIEKRLRALSKSIMVEIGVDFNARAEIYNSSEGKRLKIKTELSNNGLRELYAGWIGFQVNGGRTAIVDSAWIRIRPMGTILKEYPVAIDPRNLESIDLESILFIGKVKYDNSEIEFEYIAKGREQESFSLEIIPDFIILKPFDKSRVDKFVKQTKVKLIFNKPADFSGPAKIDIRTPQFVKAGAFDPDIFLNRGDRSIELNIPLVATKSLAKRLHEISISIVSGGQILASDIVYLRQSDFSLAKVQGIALFPDHDGLLEDIMISGGAEYRVISNRLVKAGEFNLYELLVFGTRFYENYTESDLIRDKVKKYLENGGTVVVFGQPDDWNGAELPITIIPNSVNISPDQINIIAKDNRLFKNKALVQPDGLKKQVSAHYPSSPAVVHPGNIILGYSGQALLSETEIGRGKLIYCGLPLLTMFRDLKPEAINLLTNILSSSR